jgi:hypothetical protein
MARFEVLAHRITTTTFVKVYEAETMEAAEQLAEAEVEGMTSHDLRYPAVRRWVEHDSETEVVLQFDVTKELTSEQG